MSSTRSRFPHSPRGLSASLVGRASAGGLGLLLPLLLLASCQGEEPRSGEAANAGQETAAAPDADRPRQAPPGNPPISNLGFRFGSPDAPVEVLELSDFGCGYCRRFHQETFPSLHEEFVETGKVEWVYIPFVLGIFPNGREAAQAGECAGEQDGFEEMRDRLYQNQPEWRRSDDPIPLFSRYAEEEGLDAARLRTCLEEGWAVDRVEANIEVGRRVGMRGTPAFLVDGFLVQGAIPLEMFRDALNRHLVEIGAENP